MSPSLLGESPTDVAYTLTVLDPHGTPHHIRLSGPIDSAEVVQGVVQLILGSTTISIPHVVRHHSLGVEL
jgi:hypothetical protein